jgi:hypothetical protein
LNKHRRAFLLALGGKCKRCGCTDLSRLEIHDTTGEHRGYGNPQRIKDIRTFAKTGYVPPGRKLIRNAFYHILW